MATQADVRRIALSLSDTVEHDRRFAFAVRTTSKPKEFVWVWMERIVVKKPRVANPAVLAVRVATLAEQELLIAVEPEKFFTEPHYAGFPAVLVRLAAVTAADLRKLIEGAWRCRAPSALVKGTIAAPPKRSRR